MNAIISNSFSESAPVNLSAVVDDGTREIPLLNKFGRKICNIYIRPADYSIIDRYDAMKGRIEKIVEPLKTISINNDGTASFEEDWATLKRVEQDIKHEFNILFDMEEADDIFAKRNAFSSVGGQFFALRVFEALGGVIEQAVSEEVALSKKRLEKYLTPSEVSEGDNGVRDAAYDS